METKKGWINGMIAANWQTCHGDGKCKSEETVLVDT